VPDVEQSVTSETVAIAAATPAQVVAFAADGTGAHGPAERIRCCLDGVSIVDYVLTTGLWGVVFWRGILCPAFGGANNLRASWGGPTLAGAWAVHLGIFVGALLLGSFAFALAHRRSWGTRTL
jgi:hypothetical protein